MTDRLPWNDRSDENRFPVVEFPRTHHSITPPPWLIPAYDGYQMRSGLPVMVIEPGVYDPLRAEWERGQEFALRPEAGPMPEMFPSADEPQPPARELWDYDAAEIVVDTLYRFLHAMERWDVDEAMRCIAAEYHSMEGDVEVDRNGIRLRIEASLDRWRGGGLTIQLTKTPEPVFHEAGILFRAVIQVDYDSAREGRPVTELLNRVLLFRMDHEGEWAIASMVSFD